MKILITGGTSATALKLLKAFTEHQIILAAYGEVPAITSPAYTLISLGERNNDTIAHTLLNNCLDQAVDAILPLHNFEIEAVAKSEILFNEFNIEILLPKREKLAAYFVEGVNEKGDDFVVFKNGEALFVTNAMELLKAKAEMEKLSGVYYFNATRLHLITI